MTLGEFARYFDHTALKADIPPSAIEQLCEEAKKYRFRTVCVNPVYVPIAKRLLADSDVDVCTVVGFPLGASGLENKLAETRLSLAAGAREIDMVIWVGGLKAGISGAVREEIRQIADICHEQSALLKVIIECALLTDAEKRKACLQCVEAKADMVKTSTGFAASGATVHDVKFMSDVVKSAGLGVKAAGGIRTLDDALAMIEAGATRLGASASVDILREASARGLK